MLILFTLNFTSTDDFFLNNISQEKEELKKNGIDRNQILSFDLNMVDENRKHCVARCIELVEDALPIAKKNKKQQNQRAKRTPQKRVAVQERSHVLA